ncbi:MAG: hypothetical protein HXY53_09605 [Nitrospirae bacterium]|nr:hypothetical protein [Nitrospirota bacterium]
MKARKCIKCDNSTHQEDGVCVICRLGIKQVYSDLIDLLKKDKNFNFRRLKIAKIG